MQRESQDPMRRKLVVIVAVVAGVIAVIAGVLAFRLASQSSPAQAGPVVDAEFTYFNGESGSLADFRGTPLVVNFWASWCPACIAEMPDFEQVHQRLQGQVEFLGLNMQEIDRASAERLVELTGVTYHLGEDPDGSIYRQFGGIAMPTTLFIDADGRLVDTHAGALFGDDLEAKIRQELLRG